MKPRVDERTPLKFNSYELLNQQHSGLTPSSVIVTEGVNKTYEQRRALVFHRIIAGMVVVFVFIIPCIFAVYKSNSTVIDVIPRQEATIVPFSFVDPRLLGFQEIDRPESSRPGPIFGDLRKMHVPLPTNSWCENLFLGGTNSGPMNNVFQLPYIIDSAGIFPGIRTHPVHVQANDRTVMMTYEHDDGVTLGAVEDFVAQHEVAADKNLAIARLSVVLVWKTDDYSPAAAGSMIYSPIVRGAPYTSIVYEQATPRLYAQRGLSSAPIFDGKGQAVCGTADSIFGAPFTVQRELILKFDVSDFTWILFVSEPTEFVCSSAPNTVPPRPSDGNAVVAPREAGWEKLYPHFELHGTKPLKKGMLRLALANNCTSGQNMIFCEGRGQQRDQEEYTKLLRNHAEIYPSGNADIEFAFPATAQEEDELRLSFNWAPGHMSRIASIAPGAFNEVQADDVSSDSHSAYNPTSSSSSSSGKGYLNGGTDKHDYRPPVETLMFAIPHHQERLKATPESSNLVVQAGCSPTLHGQACPVVGSKWSLVEHLHRASFYAPRQVRPEMLPAIRKALETDLKYEIPLNYQRGAGDTYFAGKMLAKLARVLIIADEIGGVELNSLKSALGRLRSGVEIWINGSASAPLLYDTHWGGLISCGCDFDGDTQDCRNQYPNCPAMTDAGQNFGHGFYNDHHFHYGYHIYAAAVVAKFDYAWARRHHEHVMTMVRDIANPSPEDPYFPTWRHKDWYLGFSWASGIVTIGGTPYPNGRNQESSSEAISAYEAVALYGDVTSKVFSGTLDPQDIIYRDSATKMANMGRLLYSTEIRSAKTYWHVQSPESDAARIYPSMYTPKVVGMVWSMLVQEQTWFGNEPYKSYGIQLMPITPASELRDSPGWVNEMLPLFNQSCAENPGCEKDGWSVLVFASLATVGRWREAWSLLDKLSPQVYEMAGGNGHSRTNSLWFIATRPDPEL